MKTSLPFLFLAAFVTAGCIPPEPTTARNTPTGQQAAEPKEPAATQRVQATQIQPKAEEPSVRELCIMALDSRESVRNRGLEALQKVRPDLHRQMRALLTSIDSPRAEPPAVEISRIDSRWERDRDSKVAALTANVKNVNERTIVNLQVTITFFDATGKIVDQETCEVINSSLVHASNKGRLPPGHSRFFAFRAKNCPPEWHEGKVAIDVHAIDFAG